MIVLCAGLMILMLRFPETSALAARDALRLWSIDVVPSLFPYMVLCRMLSGRLKQRGIREETAAAFLGLLGGSPSGAAALAG